MKAEIYKVEQIKVNDENPRFIKDDKFKQLVKSIANFPEMLEIRPVVVNKDNIIIGGNMRYRAALELGYTEIPVQKVANLTEEQEKEFTIKDNLAYGDWDWNELANNWNSEKLSEWGLEIPDFAVMPSEDELIDDLKAKPPTMKITFESPEDLQSAEIDICELIDRKYPKAYYSVSAGEI